MSTPHVHRTHDPGTHDPGTHDPGTHDGVAQRPWLLVARREVLVRLTDKGFVLGTLLTLLVTVAFVGYQAWSDQRTESYTLAVTEEAAGVADGLPGSAPDDVVLEVVEVDDAAAGEALLREGDADALLAPASEGWALSGLQDVPGELESLVTEGVRLAVLSANAARAGTDLESLETGAGVEVALLEGDAERQTFATVMGVALAFLFYMTTLGFGYMIAGSVAEEKSSRVVEIIASKIPVRQLLVGKIAGSTALALGQVALVAAVGVVGISFTSYGDLLPAVSAGIGWFIAFFVVGFCFLACWWAVAGALASRTEDLQTTGTPLTFLMMAVFFGAFLLDGTALVVASFLPPFSCVLMPMRLLADDVALWQPVLALALLLVAMAATTVLAERLYRRALLQTQGRLGLREAWGGSGAETPAGG